MWGPKIDLWNRIETLKDYTVFNSLYNHGREWRLQEDKYLDFFFMDRETADDLDMTPRPIGDRGVYEQDSSCGRFFGNGFTDYMFPKGRTSKVARDMFMRSVMIPETTAEGVTARQDVFRYLSDPKTLRFFGEMFRNLYFEGSYERKKVRMLDYILDPYFASDRHGDTPEGLRHRAAVMRNIAGVILETGKHPELRNLYNHLSEVCGAEMMAINEFLLSERYALEVSGDLLKSGASAKGYTTDAPFKPFPLMGERASNLAVRLGECIAWSFLDYYKYSERHAYDIASSLGLFEACVQFADQMIHSDVAWCLPEMISSDEPFVEIDGMVHPNYIDKGIVVGDIRLGGDRLINILTGSNDGGKTQFIKGLGQTLTLAHAGYPIPAKRARMSLQSRVLTNFSGKDNESKGRYKRSLERWCYLLNNLDGAVVLADEPTDGTFPETGVKHGIKALRALSRRNMIALSTTHYHDMARAAESGDIPRAHNLHAETKTRPDGMLAHTFRILDGADLKSYGDEVAQEVGFTDENLEKIAQGYRNVFRGYGPVELTNERDRDDYDDDDPPF